MSAKRLVVIGSSFAGLTGALEAKRLGKKDLEVTVITKDPLFTYIPSLIWYVQRQRDDKDITIEVEPLLNKRGIRTVLAEATKILPEQNLVQTTAGEIPYDYLLIGTGPAYKFEAIPGLGPHGGFTQSVCNLAHAHEARKAWEEFLRAPGPIVVGAAQGASCFGGGYEFCFNIEHAARKAGIRAQAPVTWITSEPFLGHFGLGGVGKSTEVVTEFFKRKNIEARPNSAISAIEKDKIILADGTVLPYKFAMIVPPFQGAQVIRNSEGVGNAAGWVEVDATYRHKVIPNIYAAGVAVAAAPPVATPVPTGVPKTGHMSEMMGLMAAKNIVAAVRSQAPEERPFQELPAICLMDGGNGGVLMMVDKVIAKPRKREILWPAWFMHLGKILFEQYFLWKVRHGKLHWL